MNKGKKISLIIASILIFLGMIVFVGALVMVNFDITKISSQEIITHSYEFTKDFEDISIDTETAKVEFELSTDGVCRIKCDDYEKMTHYAEVVNNKLKIYFVDTRKWYERISFISFRSPKITVFLPKNIYNSISIKEITGNVNISNEFDFKTVEIDATTSNISCFANVTNNIDISTTTGNITLSSKNTQTVNLSATTGNITAKNIACDNLSVENTTGEISLENVVAQNNIKAQNSTGGINLNGCDALDLTITTSTGNVKGTLLSGKTFLTKTSTGKVNVPQTTSGGTCKITTSTGNIEIKIQ